MQINSHTPQSALAQLYRSVTRREMLRCTPLNLRLLLRYALLFIMFPGMVLGFWVGLGITLAYCVALIILLSMGQMEYASAAVQIWLICGVVVFAWVCFGASRTALAKQKLRESYREAEQGLAARAKEPLCAVEQPLHWHKSDDGASWQAELIWHAPAEGIYAALLTVRGMGRRRLLTLGVQGGCTVHTVTTAEGNLQALLLYKLKAGDHALRWALLPRAGEAPAATVTLLCRPETNGLTIDH